MSTWSSSRDAIIRLDEGTWAVFSAIEAVTQVPENPTDEIPLRSFQVYLRSGRVLDVVTEGRSLTDLVKLIAEGPSRG